MSVVPCDPDQPAELFESTLPFPILICNREDRKSLGLMSHPATGPSHHHHAPPPLRIQSHCSGRTGRPGRRCAGFAWTSIVCWEKSDSTVSNSFPFRTAPTRQERRGWQMTPNICVTWVIQMRDFASPSSRQQPNLYRSRQDQVEIWLTWHYHDATNVFFEKCEAFLNHG